jgi:EAL domain-containing protein (putative c-di-GMP-specific phosphodiesterase class I)
MAVVAEGVENEAQMSLLAGLGCTHLQGYLFSHPISAKALAKLPNVSLPDLALRSSVIAG